MRHWKHLREYLQLTWKCKNPLMWPSSFRYYFQRYSILYESLGTPLKSVRSHSHTLLDDAKLYSLYSQNTQSFRDCGNELFTSTCRVRGIKKEYIQEKIQDPYTAVLNTSPPTDSRWVLTLPTYSRPWRWGYVLRVERLYCKRPILRLASSKILTPHPPRRPASV